MSASAATDMSLVQTGSTELANYNTTKRDANAITTMLQGAAERFHLVSPATACGELPEGCSIAFSSVLIDASDTYDTKGGGKRGLHKVALDRIAAAAGVSWDSERSRRLDDGRDPHFCAFQAVGTYRHFDGREAQIVGTKQMDLRKGSAQIAGMQDKELGMQRAHIVSHAETKARLRAIRSLGIKSSYTPEELRKPFVVARLMFTGHSNDPEIRKVFATMQARQLIAGSRALYENNGPAVHSTAPASPALMAAPPIDGSFDEEDDDYETHQPARQTAVAQSVQQTAPVQQPVTPIAQQQPAQGSILQNPAAHAEPVARSGVTIPGGKSKGVAIEDASDDDLTYWATRIRNDLPTKEARFQASDAKKLAAMDSELARRNGQNPIAEGW